MSDNEIQTLKKDVSQLKTDVAEIKTEQKSLKEDVTEIKADIKELMKTVNTNHLYFVDNYVKKSEFNEYKKNEVVSRRWWAGYIIGGTTLLLTFWKMISPYLFKTGS